MENNDFSLFLPVTEPPATAVQRTMAIIEGLEAELQGYDNEITAAEAKITVHQNQILALQMAIADLRFKQTNVKHALDDHRSALAPIIPSRLPLEVVGEVFQNFVADPSCSPWLLTKICRAWRQIALGTPRLWSGLFIHPNGYVYGHNRYEKGKENCLKPHHLRRALSRAKNAPLDIILSGSFYSRADIVTQGNGGHAQQLWEMLDMIGGNRMQQWRSVKFEMSEGDWGDYFEGDISLEFVEDIAISFPLASLANLLSKSSRSLCKLAIPVHNATNWKSGRILGRLEELVIVNTRHSYWEGETYLSVKDLESFLDCCSRLTKLTVHVREHSTSESLLHAPSTLTELNVHSGLTKWNNVLSACSVSLTRLTIQHLSNDIKDTHSSVLLPALVWLKAINPLSIKGLSCLICPVLEHLVLEGGFSNLDESMHDLKDHLVAHIDEDIPSPLAPRTLTISDSRYTFHALRHFLTSMPSVEEVSISGSSLPKTFFSFFYAINTHQDGSKTLKVCPKLKRGTFTVSRYRRRGKQGLSYDDVYPILQKAIDVRVEMGVPLEYLCLPGLYTYDIAQEGEWNGMSGGDQAEVEGSDSE